MVLVFVCYLIVVGLVLVSLVLREHVRQAAVLMLNILEPFCRDGSKPLWVAPVPAYGPLLGSSAFIFSMMFSLSFSAMAWMQNMM